MIIQKANRNNELCFVRFLFQSVSLRYFHLIVYPPKIIFLYEVFEIKEYNRLKTDYIYIDKEVNSLC